MAWPRLACSSASRTAGWAPAELSLANERGGGGGSGTAPASRRSAGRDVPARRGGGGTPSTTVRPRVADGPSSGAIAGPQLTTAERRVAEVVLARPQLVGFGTVADLAEAATAGVATVVRLAAKLGFDGFSALQASIQRDLARQLRPAAERIREPRRRSADTRHRRRAVERPGDARRSSIPPTLDAVVGLLADGGHEVLVLAGDAERVAIFSKPYGEHSARNGPRLRSSASTIRYGNSTPATFTLRIFLRWRRDNSPLTREWKA